MKAYCGGGAVILLLPIVLVCLLVGGVVLWCWGDLVAHWTTVHIEDKDRRRLARLVGKCLTLPGLLLAGYWGALGGLVTLLAPTLGVYAVLAGLFFFATLFAALPGIVVSLFPVQK